MMKKIAFISVFSLVALMACNKQAEPVAVAPEAGQEIVIGCDADGIDMNVETKATALTALPSSLYWGATTGTSTEAQKWAAASASVSSSKISTGKYQTASPTAYNYYVANQTFTVGANTTMSVANNNTDIVAGRTAASTSATPSVALNHIFARTGTVTLNPKSGYTLSNVSWKIKRSGDVSGTSGTYNMKTSAWTAGSGLTDYASLTSSSDMYLVPGQYLIEVAYTLTKGDNVQSYTKHATVTLVGGKVNNITATATGVDASEIVITVTLTGWGTQDINATWSD